MLNSFRKAIEGSKPPVGTLVMSGSPLITELLACSGFDFLVIDTEHSLNSLPGLVSQMQAVAAAGSCMAVVRLAGHDPVRIKQVMDVAAVDTLMFPMVDTVEQARALVGACTYPPRGFRGFARMNRATRFNTIPDYVQTASDRQCLIMQVETEEAMNNAVAIGKTEGVHSVFFGLGDLSVIMGVKQGLEDPEFKRYVQARLNECRKAAIPVGAFILPVDHARWFLSAGGSYVSVGVDLKSLMDTAREQIRALS